MFRFKEYLEEAMDWKVLQHGDLTKDPSRGEMFLAKIRGEEEFATTKGLVKIKKDELDKFTDGMNKSGFSASVATSKATLTYRKDFYKTGEFGGRGKGSGVAAENAALKLAQNSLVKVLEKAKDPYIMLRVGNRTVQCAAIISTPNPGGRDPKSDFAIVDPKGEMVAHISHKAGRKATDFQQYGGVTDLPGEAEITAFMQTALKIKPDGLESGDTFFRKLKSDKTANKSIYGVDYGKKAVTVNNVDEFHQGTMNFVKRGKNYIITSLHKGVVGDVPRNNPYEPILVARYNKRAGRYGNINLPNSRIGIFPMAKVSGKSKEI